MGARPAAAEPRGQPPSPTFGIRSQEVGSDARRNGPMQRRTSFDKSLVARRAELEKLCLALTYGVKSVERRKRALMRALSTTTKLC